MEHAECDQSSSRKNLTNSLEQKIRCLEKQRKELLEVNQQWDQQFRSMKESYEKKVAELKTKLDAAERFLGAQEKEREQTQRDSDRLRDQTRQRLQRQEKEKESLNEELHELKKENKLLKEKNALISKKKEHYECEIKRLNKALQDALKIESSSFPEDYLGKYEMECRHEESAGMRRCEQKWKFSNSRCKYMKKTSKRSDQTEKDLIKRKRSYSKLIKLLNPS